jgi:hypothetical protein
MEVRTVEDEKGRSPVDMAAEVKAMGRLAEALGGLSPDAAARVLRWAIEAYGVAAGGLTKTRPLGAGNTTNGNEGGSAAKFEGLAELYAATGPESEADKVLVAAYWAQFGEGKAEFGSQEINSALKNLGHPIGNITSAFDNLKARKPAPVMQLKKSGTTKQARKTYKLTLAGKSAVEAMVQQG